MAQKRHDARLVRSARRSWAIRVIALIVLIAAVSAGSWPFVMEQANAVGTTRRASAYAAALPLPDTPDVESAKAAAERYNARIAREAQPVFGEVSDPFAPGKGETPMSLGDKDYQSGLAFAPGGIIGTVDINKIDVHLTIRHGNGGPQLADGAGHLYGSSLPTGQPGTHAVITAHRGLADRLMFTRLDEIRKGDAFTISTWGRPMAYRVDRIAVIQPDDVSRLKIEPGEDRVTLVTCTPYGVNTQRLLVSGHRVPGSDPAPDYGHGSLDFRVVAGLAAVWLAAMLASVWVVSGIAAERYDLRARLGAGGPARHRHESRTHRA